MDFPSDIQVYYSIAWVVPAIMGGLGALSGLFGNRKKQQEQYQKQTGSFNETSSSTTTPTYDPQALDFRNFLMGNAQNRLRVPMSDPRQLAANVTNEGVQNVNNIGRLQQTMLENTLRQRGLSNSNMGASAIANFDANRMMQIGGLLNQQPMLSRQFAQENDNLLNQRQQLAQNLFNMIPYGQSMTGNRSGTNEQITQGTVTQPGNMLGGALGGLFQGIAPFLGSIWGQQMFGKGMGNPASQAGGIVNMPNWGNYSIYPGGK